MGPAGILVHPEDVRGGVLVTVFQSFGDCLGVIAFLGQLGGQRASPRRERIRDVLEEDQPQHHVLVLRSIHRAAQLVGSLPQGVLQLLVGAG